MADRGGSVQRVGSRNHRPETQPLPRRRRRRQRPDRLRDLSLEPSSRPDVRGGHSEGGPGNDPEVVPQGEDVDVLVVCAPCQPFSSQNRKRGSDQRLDADLAGGRFAKVLRPRIIFFENVPGLAAHNELLEALKAALGEDLHSGVSRKGSTPPTSAYRNGESAAWCWRP